MGHLTWLPGVLRAAGLDVYVMPGAETRTTTSSSGVPRTMPDRPPAVIWHHTATSTAWADGHVAALLRDGRGDLPGPLAQLGVERDGTIVVVACGRANHNGASSAKYGNDAIGVEFYNAGDGVDPWPAVQLEAGQRAIAAILRHLELGADRCVGHKESDPTRKVDPRPLDMNVMRARIARYIEVTTITSESDIMATLDELRAVVRDELNKGTGNGQTSYASTLRAVLGGVQANANRLNLANGRLSVLLGRTLEVSVDELAASLADELEQLAGTSSVDVDAQGLATAVADELDRRARARLEVPGS